MARIRVIHTGGTIGMVPGADGLVPARGVVEAALARLTPKGMETELVAFDPLIDSAEIGPTHWNRILDEIAGFDGDGVVVTHGTDTMSFTGAALSQALAGIGMPIILCGAMHPLNTGGDAESNLAAALDAARGGLPGVMLAFAGRLMPAAGLVKHQSQAEDAFRSVPQAPLDGPLRPRRFRDRRLAILTLSPGLPAAALAAALDELDGAVLRVFGAGTVMSDPGIEAALARAVARGCRIRAVSQCEAGGLVPGSYAAGAPLWRSGCENGEGETAEAALIRLWLSA